MKKSWGKPIVQVQMFVPQECVAACQRITNIYLDLNDNNEYDYAWGEQITDQLGWLYFQWGDKRQFKNIKAYKGHDWRDSYISNPNYYDRTYPVVEIRRVGSLFEGYDYYAYNATS